MTNVILISAAMVASSLGTMTNDITVTGGVCMVEAKIQAAEHYRNTAFVGASIDYTIQAVRELHKEVEELRAEVKRLKEEAAKPPAAQPQFYPYPHTFPTGFYFNVFQGIVTNDCGKVAP